MRLDVHGDAVRGGDSGPAFEAGKSADSLLIKYIAGLDPDVVMPPEGDKLSKEEVALFRAWIDQGAKWPEGSPGDGKVNTGHWAFQPVRRPAGPAVKAEGSVRNTIDRFIVARLESRSIAPSPEADRRTLIRRLKFDLLGLPPTPAEIREFVEDTRPDAYELLVDRFLASPHFGERWGRHWLDLARYADSDGYEKDSPRPFAWRYRNWVIDAINNDLPFDQFTIEQLAGDLLPNATLEQKVATGFHRNTLTNKEGGVDQEEFRVAAVIDRVNTTSTVWLGLTLGCAQCHSHKYDPLLMHEYYGMFAFFNQGNEVDLPAPLPAEAEAYAKAKSAYDAAHAPFATAVSEFESTRLPERLAAWEKTLDKSSSPTWTVLEPASIAGTGAVKFARQSDGSYLATGENKPAETYTLQFQGGVPKGITALRIEVLPDAALPAKGPGRVAHGNFVLSEFRASVSSPAAADPRPIEWGVASADYSQDQFPATAAIDGDTKSGWAVAPQFGQRHVAVFEMKTDLNIAEDEILTIVLDQQHGLQHTIGRLRLSATTMPRPVQLEGFPADVAQALAKTYEQRTLAEQKKLLAHYAPLDTELAKLRQDEAEHAKQAPRPPATQAQTLAEISPPRATHIHVRGDFLRKGEEVQPHTPAVLHPFRGAAGRTGNRLDLARWLVDPANPLTARVTMNRVWKNLFGQPLVTSVDDFGTRGEKPSHPDLLDWLAAEFVSPSPPLSKGGAGARGGVGTAGNDRGGEVGANWSVKRMIRLIVRSATYRQSSQPRSELAERDPRNVWLARQGRFRVEAEVLRDACLAASGLLTPTVGGPSVRPKQPAGISELTYAGSARWVESTGPDRYRRGLYTWFQRTSPYPMLMTFDAPESNVTCTRRDRSNTPLQALTLLNDPVFHECSQALGRRMIAERAGDPAGRVAFAFELCVGRPPGDAEAQELGRLYAEFRALAEADLGAAGKLAGEPKPAEADLANTAAAIALARILLNLDETVTRE
ncbi:MAG: PSD1 domain-containing protein [Planctomycetia bacterium]|nr:PSD1 domain-containing protein [Planctomycetia bacterium]